MKKTDHSTENGELFESQCNIHHAGSDHTVDNSITAVVYVATCVHVCLVASCKRKISVDRCHWLFSSAMDTVFVAKGCGSYQDLGATGQSYSIIGS